MERSPWPQNRDIIGRMNGPPPSPMPLGPPPQPLWQPYPPFRPRRWPLLIPLIVSVAAIGLAIAGWLRPLPADRADGPPPPAYTEQQVADAKTRVCAAYNEVHQAVLINTGRDLGDNPTSHLAVAANARIALFDGGQFLSAELVEEPATPPELASAIRALIKAYEQLAIDYLANVPDAQLKPSEDNLTKTGTKVYDMCR
jgi:hypothetical protein